MPRSRAEKESIIQDMKERLADCQSAVLVDYRRLNVAEATRLRRRLREADCEFKIAKNTLVSLAAEQVGLEGLKPFLEGQMAIAFGADPVAPAKILSGFIRETKKMEIKAGVLEGEVIDVEGVKALAGLPSREELLARVLGGMQAPLYNFAGVLQGTIRSMVYTLEAIRKMRAEEA
ncbi:MAG: 50S ribosomal protein L10 [Peptococcaceae bacterium]|nr:50S ribosomal protein L10 [Candidatus Syntrophopropionicum ammoniitolerans]